MDWKWYLKIGFSLIFFMFLVIVGSNISAQRLAVITDQDISPPFICKKLTTNVVELELLGNSYDYSLVPVIKGYTHVKSSIQSSLSTVKCNLVPRFEYLNYHWSKGVDQLKSDFKNIVDFR